MTIQHIELQNIQISKANPRKAFDEEKINGLAESILTDGLLQNLVVQPIQGKEGKFSIVSGERRVRAMRKLMEQGRIEKEYKVPAFVRDDLNKGETLRIATVENVQRENLTPLEEASAFAKLVKGGNTLENIASETGLSKRTIKQRIALNGLCSKAKEALAEGNITLAQAKALTLGTSKAQENALEYIRDYTTADDIRQTLIRGKPTVSMAKFPIEEYKGRIVCDLFADDETSYFDDEDQFFNLQKKAVQDLADHYYRQTPAKWVEVTENYSLNDWQYEEAKEDEPYGILINISPCGEIEIKEGLVKPQLWDKEIQEETTEAPQKTARPLYSKPMCQYVAWHKSLAVQEVLLLNPRKAKELAVLQAITSLEPHECLFKVDALPDQHSAFAVIEERANEICGILKIELDVEVRAYEALASYLVDTNGSDIYQTLQGLSDEELEDVLIFAAIITFGQFGCSIPDIKETSLFNLIANDIEVEMRKHWTPDITFLNGRTRNQLAEIAGECGFDRYVGGYKKMELVNGLLEHFQKSRQAGKPTSAQEKANNWLPSVMQFPATLRQDEQETGA